MCVVFCNPGSFGANVTGAVDRYMSINKPSW